MARRFAEYSAGPWVKVERRGELRYDSPRLVTEGREACLVGNCVLHALQGWVTRSARVTKLWVEKIQGHSPPVCRDGRFANYHLG